MREIEFKGYFGDEELFVKVALNEKKKKISKKDILTIVEAFRQKAQEKGVKGDIEMFGVSPKEFKKEADNGNVVHEGGYEYSITDGYLWLTWGAYWEEIQKVLYG